jgi:hypothetical protein
LQGRELTRFIGKGISGESGLFWDTAKMALEEFPDSKCLDF